MGGKDIKRVVATDISVDAIRCAQKNAMTVGYIFTGNMALAKKVGLRTKRRMIFYNGDIECRLLKYELYSGSREG